jgi:streptogramin lyase
MLANLYRRWMRLGNPGTLRRQTLAGASGSQHRAMPRVELLEDRSLPSASVAEFPVPSSGGSPFGITAGPDGNLWFTENQADQIGTINPTTHAVSEYAIPTIAAGPMGIVTGPDGNLWFTEYAANQIGEINPSTHAISEFAVPTAMSGPSAITLGPDGNLWFTEFNASQIGEINPATHTVQEFALASGSNPLGIAAGPDGNVWFAEAGANFIATINPIQHTIAQYTIPQGNSQPYDITPGPNGSMWFTENAGNAIGRITTASHVFSTYPIPSSGSGPYGIAAGADGNVWFVEPNGNRVGTVFLPSGVVGETTLPTADAAPIAMVAGTAGTLWFTEANANQIGQVVDSPTIIFDPVSHSAVAGQSTTFSATAIGFPTPTVRWEVSTNGGATFSALSNGGVYSGVTTGTLGITGATSAMDGYRYEAVFTNGVGANPTVTTTAARLTVQSVLSILPTPPQGTAGVHYTQTLSVLGSTSAFNVFSVSNFVAGGSGLTLGEITPNPVNGTITINGTPTAAGTASFTVNVANVGGDHLTKTLNITINPPLRIVTTSLPAATAGSKYSQAITVTGGMLPYTHLAVTNFSAGGTGLAAAAFSVQSVSGVVRINGTPTAGGTVSFTVSVTDSAGAVATRNFTITVTQSHLSVGSLSTTQWTVGVPGFTGIGIISGGTGPLHITSASGLPPGLSAAISGNTVRITGKPSSTGSYHARITIHDANGASVVKVFAIAINAAPAIGGLSPTQWTIGMAGFTGAMPIHGGTGSDAITNSNGLPNGLHIGVSGSTLRFSGSPTTVGTFTGMVTIRDSLGVPATRTFFIKINAAPTTGSLSTTQWTAGKSGFRGAIPIIGGTGPFTITSASGVPAGLTAVVSGSGVRFTGTPTSAGSYTFHLALHDAAGAGFAGSFKVTINAPVRITTTSLPAIPYSQVYSTTVHAVGGTGSTTFTLTAGSLPPGITLKSNGVISGLSRIRGTYHFTITATDADGAKFSEAFTLSLA